MIAEHLTFFLYALDIAIITIVMIERYERLQGLYVVLAVYWGSGMVYNS